MCISKIHIMNKVHKFESATSLSIYLNRDGSKIYLQKWLKVSRSLKYDSNIFSFTNIYIYIYGHHDRSLYPARAARAG